MRRAQSVRTYPRTSLTLSDPDTTLSTTTGLTPLRERERDARDDTNGGTSTGNTSIDVTIANTDTHTLHKRLLEKDREIDKLHATIHTLQTTLAARPPIETIHTLEKEYKNLDLILHGTQRENERCMVELERVRAREKALEQALARVAGENWQSVLDIGPASAGLIGRTMGVGKVAASPPPDTPRASVEATLSQIEQIRLLVLGMEQRMEEREQKLTKTIERAETQEAKCEALRKEVLPKLAT